MGSRGKPRYPDLKFSNYVKLCLLMRTYQSLLVIYLRDLLTVGGKKKSCIKLQSHQRWGRTGERVFKRDP